MEIIVVINCGHLDCVISKIRRAENFLKKEDWLHLDVADGSFTFNKTWADAVMWPKLKAEFNLEVHLMVEEPEKLVDRWLKAGARRLIVHLETITDSRWRSAPPFVAKLIEGIKTRCSRAGCELMLAFNPETPIESAGEYLNEFEEFMILAVHPGPSGQKFLPLTLEKVKSLRQKFPNAKIEIDGGINHKTADLAKTAGANMAASGAYIFESEDPKRAYRELRAI